MSPLWGHAEGAGRSHKGRERACAGESYCVDASGAEWLRGHTWVSGSVALHVTEP